MIVSFFESIKYVGHFWPLCFLRVFVGYYYFDQALMKVQGDYLDRPIIAATVNEWLPSSNAPEWYKSLVEQLVPPHWQIFAYLLICVQFLIGFSYLAGYMVRPATLIAIVVCLNSLMLTDPVQLDFQKLLLAIVITLGWIGAGRCLGMDYFFFKRRRGLWW